MLLIGASVLVTVFVDRGRVKVTSTVPVTVGCMIVEELDCVGVDQINVVEVPLPAPVTRGIVVKLKEGNGVKMRGMVKVVVGVACCSDPVSFGREVVLLDGNGALEDIVPLMTNRVVV